MTSSGAFHSHPLFISSLGPSKKGSPYFCTAFHGNNQPTTVNRTEVCLQLCILLKKSADGGGGWRGSERTRPGERGGEERIEQIGLIIKSI